MNYYQILQVPEDATDDQIRAAYLRLVQEKHPDRHVGEDDSGAKQEFQRIQESYEVLHDAERRAKYDQFLAKRIPDRRRRPRPQSTVTPGAVHGVNQTVGAQPRARDIPHAWTYRERRQRPRRNLRRMGVRLVKWTVMGLAGVFAVSMLAKCAPDANFTGQLTGVTTDTAATAGAVGTTSADSMRDWLDSLPAQATAAEQREQLAKTLADSLAHTSQPLEPTVVETAKPPVTIETSLHADGSDQPEHENSTAAKSAPKPAASPAIERSKSGNRRRGFASKPTKARDARPAALRRLINRRTVDVRTLPTSDRGRTHAWMELPSASRNPQSDTTVMYSKAVNDYRARVATDHLLQQLAPGTAHPDFSPLSPAQPQAVELPAVNRVAADE